MRTNSDRAREIIEKVYYAVQVASEMGQFSTNRSLVNLALIGLQEDFTKELDKDTALIKELGEALKASQEFCSDFWTYAMVNQRQGDKANRALNAIKLAETALSHIPEEVMK